ncbi:hypothetical protein ANTRET_LOCUS1 [Anthophora retusa]
MAINPAASSEAMTTEVGRVAIRVPQFWPDKPALWFCQVEGQFALNGITQDSTKFFYVMSQLDNRYAQELLEHEEIGDRTPSQFLRHLRNLAGTAVPDEFLRTLWLNRLPTAMRAILATQTDTPLNKTAELADKINEVNPRGQHCATISSDSRIDLLCQQIAELSRQVVELKQGAATHSHSHRRPYAIRSQ